MGYTWHKAQLGHHQEDGEKLQNNPLPGIKTNSKVKINAMTVTVLPSSFHEVFHAVVIKLYCEPLVTVFKREEFNRTYLLFITIFLWAMLTSVCPRFCLIIWFLFHYYSRFLNIKFKVSLGILFNKIPSCHSALEMEVFTMTHVHVDISPLKKCLFLRETLSIPLYSAKILWALPGPISMSAPQERSAFFENAFRHLKTLAVSQTNPLTIKVIENKYFFKSVVLNLLEVTVHFWSWENVAVYQN